MQCPAEMRWEIPKCVGDLPKKRSGHTFTAMDSFAYMFGGCVAGGENPPGPTNDLYKLDMCSDSEFYWIKLKPEDGGAVPTSRWHHSANKISDSRIVVFGGFSSHKHKPRLNDIWVLDTVDDTWYSQDKLVAEDSKFLDEAGAIWKTRG